MTVFIDKDQVDKNISRAAKIIRQGGLVAFPTETVYGLGGDGLNPKAIEKIFKAKNRPADNPLILHVSGIKMAEDLITGSLGRAKILIDEFWPGPLTLIFKKSPLVPYEASGGLETVAIRMPNNDIALKLIKASDRPIAGPSANLSGRPSPTDASTVYEDLNGRIDMILDGGPSDLGLESTVLDLTSHDPLILRPGGVSLEKIREFYPSASYDRSIIKEGQAPKSPGQKYKHYAPKTPAYLFIGDQDHILANIEDFVREDLSYGYMVSQELANRLHPRENDHLIVYGSIKNYRSIAENIFRLLRNLDKKNVDQILIEGVSYQGLGLAIMNRLEKSTGGKIIGK